MKNSSRGMRGRRITRREFVGSAVAAAGVVTGAPAILRGQNEFDAVVVSTAEHTHAFATYLALTHGKHVYCEKPLTYNIWEARPHSRDRREVSEAVDADGQPGARVAGAGGRSRKSS